MGSEDTFQTTTDEDLRIRENPRECIEFVRITSLDLYLSDSGTKGTSGSSEAGKDGRIEDSGTTPGRRDGDPRGRAYEAGPSGIDKGESEIIVLIELCCCIADKTNVRTGKKA